MYGDIFINGDGYRIDLKSYRVKDILDFAPRASVAGQSVIMSDLGLYQPLVQTDFRRGFGFNWYQDAAGYMSTFGDMDTRQDGIAMRFTKKIASDTDNYRKNGLVNFGGYLWSWGVGGLRKYNGTAWSTHEFSGIEVGQTYSASAEATTSLKYPATVQATGQNKMLVVRVGVRSSATVTSVTYGGNALTKLDTIGTDPKTEIWYLMAPTDGTADVEILIGTASSITSGATAYIYVDQTTPFETPIKTSGTGTSVSNTISTSVGNLIIDAFTKQGPESDAIIIGDSQTYDYTGSVGGTSTMEADGTRADGIASLAMTRTWTNSRAYSAIAVAIRPATQPVVGDVNFAYNGGDYLFYCQSGERIRKISADLVDSSAGIDANAADYSWMIAFNGLLYAGKRNCNRVHYASESDASDLEGTVDDISAIYVGAGSTVETKRPAIYASALYVMRFDGLFQIGEDGVARKVVDYAPEASTTNFRSSAVLNGFLVYPIRDRLVQWNSVRVNDITPDKINDTFPYITYGSYNNFVSADNFLYMTARTNETSPKEALICYDGSSFHKLADICEGDDTVSAMYYDAVLGRIWFHLDSTNDVTYYIQLQTNSPFPYPYFDTTGEHGLITSRLDMGFRRVMKSMTSLTLETENLSDTRYIDVYFQLEGDGTWHHWDKVTTSGTNVLDNPAGKITREFYFAQLKFVFVTDSDEQSPILNAWTMRFIMRPEVAFGWNFNIVAATGYREDLVTEDERSSAEIVRDLREIRNSKKPITFTDVLGDSYTAYLTAMSETPTYRKDQAEGEIQDIEYSVNVNIVSVGD